MFQALFNSLSGLFSFSRSLDTVSNNVSNMNTPGFRGSDSFFANIDGGYGTSIAGQGLRPQPGDMRQTGTPTDMAVEGEGYFVLRDRSGELHYTRAGQFRFNDSGVLVDTATGYDVMAI
ncbi:flagellar hook basal-body protein, partial [Streptomyces sp. S9]|nr:flagellar hook basal-body protein [Streptomyces sp. S9]